MSGIGEEGSGRGNLIDFRRDAQKALAASGNKRERGGRAWLTSSTADWEEEDLKPRPWLAPGYLMRSSVSILGGAPSAGKSLVAILWAVACALGRPVGLFKPVGPLRVSYYSIEDDEMEFRKRVSAALRFFGASTRDMEGRLNRIHPNDDPDLFKWGISEDGRTYELINAEAWDEIREGIRKHRPDVFMFDPLVEINSAPENDNAAQRAVISRFRSFARRPIDEDGQEQADYTLAPLIIDHSRKPGMFGDDDPDDANQLRGASSKVGAARNVITCSVMTKTQANKWGISTASRKAYCQVVGAKANYSALGWGEWFEKIGHVLKGGEETAGVQPWAPPKDAAVDPIVLDELMFQISRGWDSEPYAARVDNGDRSLRLLFGRNGIGKKDEPAMIAALEKAGAKKQHFRTERTRRVIQGWRSSAGLPKVKWLIASILPDGTNGWCDDSATVAPQSAIMEGESAIVAESSQDPSDLFGDLY